MSVTTETRRATVATDQRRMRENEFRSQAIVQESVGITVVPLLKQIAYAPVFEFTQIKGAYFKGNYPQNVYLLKSTNNASRTTERAFR